MNHGIFLNNISFSNNFFTIETLKVPLLGLSFMVYFPIAYIIVKLLLNNKISNKMVLNY